MEQKHKRKYQPKTTGQINWSSKKDKKRLAKAEQKDSVAYEKQDYCLESPKFTEYYTVSATERKSNLQPHLFLHSLINMSVFRLSLQGSWTARSSSFSSTLLSSGST
jgi:hypothetical protein